MAPATLERPGARHRRNRAFDASEILPDPVRGGERVFGARVFGGASTEGRSTAMAIKLSREQREAIYAEVVVDLSGTGDISIELDNGDYDAARRLRRRFEDDMRLLDEIGWEPDPDEDEFELSMPPDQLARALRWLGERARATVHTHVVEPITEHAYIARTVAAQAAYGDLLAQLAEQTDRERDSGADAGS